VLFGIFELVADRCVCKFLVDFVVELRTFLCKLLWCCGAADFVVLKDSKKAARL